MSCILDANANTPTRQRRFMQQLAQCLNGGANAGDGLLSDEGVLSVALLDEGGLVFELVADKNYIRVNLPDVSRVVRTVTASTTILLTDDILLVDASAGDVTIDLIDAATRHWTYDITKIDSSPNKVTIDGDVGQTINGDLTIDLILQDDSVTLAPVAASSEWRII